MTDRIHQVLDGELPESSLTAEERLRLQRTRQALDAVGEVLRDAPPPDLTDRVMAGLEPAEESSPTRAERLAAWLWQPRQFVLRPVYAFAASLLLVLPFAFSVGDPGSETAEVTAVSPDPSAAPAVVYVQFRFEAPGAAQVELAGSFTEWSPSIRLSETMPGIWSGMVPLEPGVHDYTFVIDGEQWVADPAAPRVDDGFGGENSRLFLTAPEGHA